MEQEIHLFLAFVSFLASELQIDLKPVETVLVRMDTATKVSLRMIELLVDENNSDVSALVVYFTLAVCSSSRGHIMFVCIHMRFRFIGTS